MPVILLIFAGIDWWNSVLVIVRLSAPDTMYHDFFYQTTDTGAEYLAFPTGCHNTSASTSFKDGEEYLDNCSILRATKDTSHVLGATDADNVRLAGVISPRYVLQ